MKSQVLPFWLSVVSVLVYLFALTAPSIGQSLTTGGVVGTVTDPSGAAGEAHQRFS